MCDAEYIKTKLIEWLLEGNLSFRSSQNAIGTEVLFSHNRRRADLLIFSDNLHALEIKSDFDNLGKLREQLNDYSKTFDRVSVVTTPKHLKKVAETIKLRIGLILFAGETFKIIRQSYKRKRLDKYSLLMFLSKNELTALFKVQNIHKLSTDELRNIIVQKLTTYEIREAAYSSLRRRYSQLFRLFRQDIGNKVLVDDLRGLCGQISELST